MRRCEELAAESAKLGNPAVGSLIVFNGNVIGEGLELGRSKNDITYHAEIECIRAAVKKLGGKKLLGATLYTTHEPCIMCSYVIRHYQVGRVIIKHKVQEFGGESSGLKILSTTQFPSWSNPPDVIFLGES